MSVKVDRKYADIHTHICIALLSSTYKYAKFTRSSIFFLKFFLNAPNWHTNACQCKTKRRNSQLLHTQALNTKQWARTLRCLKRTRPTASLLQNELTNIILTVLASRCHGCLVFYGCVWFHYRL